MFQTIDSFISTPAGFIVYMVFMLIVIAAILTIFDQWGDKDWVEREYSKINRRG